MVELRSRAHVLPEGLPDLRSKRVAVHPPKGMLLELDVYGETTWLLIHYRGKSIT